MTITSFPTDQPISQTLSDAKQQVRDNPTEAGPRIFLFQLLAVAGDWSRALSQLNLCGELDAAALPMVQTYREALACEALRESVFAGDRSPLVFGEPEPWIASLTEALRLESRGEAKAASHMREAAFAEAPMTAGTILTGDETETRFTWIADGDTRLGPTVEAVINGKYYWVPWHNVRQLHIEAPADLRDLVWMPAHFTLNNGGEVFGLIPTRYPGSQQSDDDGIRMAKKTHWQETAEGGYHGLGQRMFATDVNEFPVMDIRTITIDPDVAMTEPHEEA